MITLRNETTGAITEHSSVQAARQAARQRAFDEGHDESTDCWLVTDNDGTRYRGTRNQSQQRNPGGRTIRNGESRRLEWQEMIRKDETRTGRKSNLEFGYKDVAGGKNAGKGRNEGSYRKKRIRTPKAENPAEAN